MDKDEVLVGPIAWCLEKPAYEGPSELIFFATEQEAINSSGLLRTAFIPDEDGWAHHGLDSCYVWPVYLGRRYG
jgi:hypothetical protein